MPSYVLKLFRNSGMASREIASVVIEAFDNQAAIDKAPRVQRPPIDDIALAMLINTDGIPIWVGSELTGCTF